MDTNKTSSEQLTAENEHDGQEQRAPELDGQLSFDGTEYHAEQDEQQDEHTGINLLLDPSTGEITTADGTPIKDDPEAMAEYKRHVRDIGKLWAAFAAKKRTKTHLIELYTYMKNKTGGELDDLAADLLSALPEETAAEVKAAAEKAKQDAINAGKIQARAEAVKDFILKELQKEEYNGETLDALLYDRDPADLANTDDEKTRLLMQALAAAERAQGRKRGTYLTEAKQRQEGNDAQPIPDHLAIISKKGYTNALDYNSLYKAPDNAQFDNAGHIVTSAKRIETQYDEYGNLFIITGDEETQERSKIKLMTAKNHEIIESINKQNLDLFFSIITYNIIEEQIIKQGARFINPAVSINAYDLAEALGTPRTKGQEAIDRAAKAAGEFNNIVGMLQNSTASRPSDFAVLLYKGYNENTGKITIESPYMTYLIKLLYKVSLRRTNSGNLEKSTTGKLLTDPMFSFLLRSELAKERDKTAYENVKIIVPIIEQAGNFTPHISARELIERNYLLADRLENAKDIRYKNKLLKRVFLNTWKYLKNDTELLTVYEDIKIPETWPTMQNLDIVFSFPNKGKIHTPRR